MDKLEEFADIMGELSIEVPCSKRSRVETAGGRNQFVKKMRGKMGEKLQEPKMKLNKPSDVAKNEKPRLSQLFCKAEGGFTP